VIVTLRIRLIIAFGAFGALLLALLSSLAFASAQRSLRAAAEAELLGISLEKRAEFEAWLEERQQGVAALTASPAIIAAAADLRQAELGSSPAVAARNRLAAELQARVQNRAYLREIFLLDPESGQVIASTNPANEGHIHDREPFFIEGRHDLYIQNIYYALADQAPAMAISAPLYDPDGRLLGVLTERLSISAINDIFQRRTGERRTDEAFLVNPSRLFVTQPRLVEDTAVLRRRLDTIPVNRCLAGQSDVVLGPDYQGVPSIVRFDWMPERELCLIVKFSQEEAFAPTVELRNQIGLAGGAVLLIGIGLAVVLAGTITQPLRRLSEGVELFGAGKLDVRLAEDSTAEFKQLARSFNQMAANLAENEQALHAQNELLEQRVAERSAALQASEQRYRTLAEAAPDIIFMVDADGKLAYLNHAAMQMGAQRVDALNGHPVEELFSLDQPEQLRDACEATRTQGARQLELQAHGPEGVIWYDLLLTPLDHSERNPTVLGIARDVSQRKQSEQALDQSRALLRTVIDSIPQSIFWKDQHRYYLGCNTHYAALAGLEHPDAIIGRHDSDLSWPGLVDTYQTDEQTVLADGQALLNREAQVIDTDGRHLIVQTSIIPLVDRYGNTTGLVGSLEDITERRRTELNYEMVIRNSLEGFLITAIEDGRFLECNDAMCRMSGYTREELLTMRIQNLDAVETPTDIANRDQALIAAGSARFATRHRRKDGEIIDVDISVTYHPDMGGRKFAFIRDTSEYRQLIEELRRRTEELARSNAELEQFAYVASHDLQEPLRMVASYIQLLSRRYAGKLDQDADEFIGYAVDGVKRMQQLISDLLAYSRVGTRGKAFEPSAIDEVLAQVLRSMQFTIEDHNARITHDPLPILPVDPTQIGQLFQNLIGNGVKFCDKVQPHIHISAEEDGDFWRFGIKDNGIGIDPQHFERIFAIFQRLHSQDEYSGTGIGLAICKRIVQRHHGRIWLDSQPGQGTTFYFTLPKTAPDGEHRSE
jgi:PAS domain S-box-containing protein